jgi:hypothetical protein
MQGRNQKNVKAAGQRLNLIPSEFPKENAVNFTLRHIFAFLQKIKP